MISLSNECDSDTHFIGQTKSLQDWSRKVWRFANLLENCIDKCILLIIIELRYDWNRLWENLLLKEWYSCDNAGCDFRAKQYTYRTWEKQSKELKIDM